MRAHFPIEMSLFYCMRMFSKYQHASLFNHLSSVSRFLCEEKKYVQIFLRNCRKNDHRIIQLE